MSSLALQQIGRCVPAVQSLVQQLQTVAATPSEAALDWELEVRFGECLNNGLRGSNFKPGTSALFFNSALHWFETCADWATVQDWTEIHEFYYKVERRVVRTTVTFGDVVTTEHKWKQKLERQNFVCQRGRVPVSHSSVAYWPDFRVELSSEEVIDTKRVSLPEVVNTQLVRIKQRKSFFWGLPVEDSAESESGDSTRPLWRYDFTRCWAGPTLPEAEQQQRSSSTVEPRYEIELELYNPAALLKRPVDQLSKSLLLKVNDFYMPSVWDTLSVHRGLSGVDYHLEPHQ